MKNVSNRHLDYKCYERPDVLQKRDGFPWQIQAVRCANPMHSNKKSTNVN